jgi:uncharacterized protein YpbB
MKAKLEEDRKAMEQYASEVYAVRAQMEGLAGRLCHVTESDQVDFAVMDVNQLFFQIASYIESLTEGDQRMHFMPVADINEMAKNVKKWTKTPASQDPRQYLPELMKLLEESYVSVKSANRFLEPLNAIFKTFDFQFDSYNPEKESFKGLRERVFQMHVLMGSETNVISDPTLFQVVKMFLSLSSTFLSYISASFLSEKEKESAYDAPKK